MVFIFFFALTRAQSGIPDGLYTYPRAVRVYDAHDIRRLKESNKATQRRKLLGRLLQQGKDNASPYEAKTARCSTSEHVQQCR